MKLTPSEENTVSATILVVDDNAENLAVLGEILQPEYQILAANTGKRALQLALSLPAPDLILLDVMMPEMDGYAVLRHLKENPATHDIPVIFVTAMDSAEDEQFGLNLGAVDYITKPLRAPIVLARVHTQLELKRARDWLQHQNTLLEEEVARRVAENELVLTTAGEGIYGTDIHGVINFINPFAANILGYKREELLGRDAHAMLHHSNSKGSPFSKEECPLLSSLRGGYAIERREDIFWHKDGSPLPIELTFTPILQDGKPRGAVVTFMDIRERKSYQAQLEYKSNFDDLTGLPNRNLLSDRLAHGIGRCLQADCMLAVLALDLGRHAEINDSLGRAYGDRVLQEVAGQLREQIKASETVARLDGDQFVLLIEGDEALTSRVQGIIKALSQPILIDTQEIFLSPRVGISVFPKDGSDIETLLVNAEVAMYKGNTAGGNNFNFYSTEMNARSLERLNLENELRRAQERDELVLYYQPQLSLRSGEIIGAEALIRWRHPQHGLVPPGQFIPLAEDTGLIIPIGEWVLRTACAQNKAWQNAGLPHVTMAVNLSARQLVVQDIELLIEEILHETNLDPNYLELELTESAVMDDPAAFVNTTNKLKALGVTLSIDDFGTGYSSLSYLKRFAINRLKIDMSFVVDITRDPNDAAIAQAVTALAHSLRLSVIAEGVETAGQLNILRRQGCDEMQGFYFSKPVPAAEFEEMLREKRRLTFPADVDLPERTILLVDDEPSILSSLKRLLRREGYTILTAGSGSEGLELLAMHQAGVVISDARMPQMSGAEFLGKVREMHPDSIRIMLSGYTELKAVTDAVNKGELFKFLTKPWDDLELVESIRNAFLYYEARHHHTMAVSP